jgi:hypothetical protein
MAAEVLHTTDHRRYGTRAFLRLVLTDDAVSVVIHEVGPVRVRTHGQEDHDEWRRWHNQLEPPTLADDVGTVYTLAREREAVGPGGMPTTMPIAMKATVSWYFRPAPPPEARRWTIDGRWSVERDRA